MQFSEKSRVKQGWHFAFRFFSAETGNDPFPVDLDFRCNFVASLMQLPFPSFLQSFSPCFQKIAISVCTIHSFSCISVFNQGEHSSFWYLLLSGEVQLFLPQKGTVSSYSTSSFINTFYPVINSVSRESVRSTGSTLPLLFRSHHSSSRIHPHFAAALHLCLLCEYTPLQQIFYTAI